MELLLVYLWLKLDTLIIAGWCSLCVGLISLLVYGICKSEVNYPCSKEEFAKKYWKSYKRILIVGIISGVFSLLLPNSKDTAILVGTHYGLSLIKSEEGKKVMTLVRARANQYLDEQIKEAVKKP